MKNINIFCFGFGQVAKNFIKKLIIEKYNVSLSTTSRGESSKKIFNGINYNNYLFNNNKFDKDLVVKLKEADHILVSIPPKNQEDLVIKNFSKFLESSKVTWITYLSATSVYGDHKGEWVNENSETNPTSVNGAARLKAENSWISLEKDNKLSVQIFRLSGIYSNKKNILVSLKSGDLKLIKKKIIIFQEFMSKILQMYCLNLYRNLSQVRYLIYLITGQLHQKKLHYLEQKY